jgi:DNA/RNA endonuclease YhcR with UshA esterase domain
MLSGLYACPTVLFREGLPRIVTARAAPLRVLTPTIKAETALDGGRGFMRILTSARCSIVPVSAVCSAGSHASKTPWSNKSSSANPSPQDCLPITEAGKHVRRQTCVTGTVIRVEEGSHGVTFLDFCPEYRNCPFTVVVFPRDLRRIGNVHQLQGRVVKIQGKIEEYDDRAEIVLRHSQQLGDDAKLLTAFPKEYDVERQGHYSAGTFRAAKAKKNRSARRKARRSRS